MNQDIWILLVIKCLEICANVSPSNVSTTVVAWQRNVTWNAITQHHGYFVTTNHASIVSNHIAPLLYQVSMSAHAGWGNGYILSAQ